MGSRWRAMSSALMPGPEAAHWSVTCDTSGVGDSLGEGSSRRVDASRPRVGCSMISCSLVREIGRWENGRRWLLAAGASHSAARTAGPVAWLPHLACRVRNLLLAFYATLPAERIQEGAASDGWTRITLTQEETTCGSEEDRKGTSKDWSQEAPYAFPNPASQDVASQDVAS